jgi:diguanylate cyclase (GGDEF)-like protein
MIAPVDVVGSSRFSWLLGHEKYQRLCLRFWLMTSSVYLVLLCLQLYSVHLGLIGEQQAMVIAATALSGISVFYIAMRSGWSLRFADPALTAPQMAFAFIMLAMAYVLTPKLRATLLIVTPLVLMFGAFTLSPRHCRMLGIFAVLAQGTAMVVASALGVDDSAPGAELVFFIGSAVIFAMAADMAARLSGIRELQREQKKALNIAVERNELLARQDDLTGLPNRRHAMEMMAYEERRAQREKVPPCICMIDLDHFKRINDTFGHAAGDTVLRLLAREGVPALRAPDILARWGGEEFILLMPETPMAEGMQVVERLHKLLAQPQIWADYPALQVTFSAGIATLRPGETIQEVVDRADTALYRAKLNGRNRTEQDLTTG